MGKSVCTRLIEPCLSRSLRSPRPCVPLDDLELLLESLSLVFLLPYDSPGRPSPRARSPRGVLGNSLSYKYAWIFSCCSVWEMRATADFLGHVQS